MRRRLQTVQRRSRRRRFRNIITCTRTSITTRRRQPTAVQRQHPRQVAKRLQSPLRLRLPPLRNLAQGLIITRAVVSTTALVRLCRFPRRPDYSAPASVLLRGSVARTPLGGELRSNSTREGDYYFQRFGLLRGRKRLGDLRQRKPMRHQFGGGDHAALDQRQCLARFVGSA